MPKTSYSAEIDESACIGCTKCLQVCPVDAIIGASKQMHVIIEPYCIGCALCLPPCPVHCISMVAKPERTKAQRLHRAHIAKSRYHARKTRLDNIAQQKKEADLLAINSNMKNAIYMAIARSQRKREISQGTTNE